MLIFVDFLLYSQTSKPPPLLVLPTHSSRSSRSTKERRSSGLQRGPCNRLWEFQRRFTGSCGFRFCMTCCSGLRRDVHPHLSRRACLEWPLIFGWTASGPSGGSSTKFSSPIHMPESPKPQTGVPTCWVATNSAWPSKLYHRQTLSGILPDGTLLRLRRDHQNSDSLA